MCSSESCSANSSVYERLAGSEGLDGLKVDSIKPQKFGLSSSLATGWYLHCWRQTLTRLCADTARIALPHSVGSGSRAFIARYIIIVGSKRFLVGSHSQMVDAKTSVEESVAVQGTAPCVSPSVFLVLSRSLANVTQLRPAGVRLQVVAIETAVSQTDNRVLNVYFQHHHP